MTRRGRPIGSSSSYKVRLPRFSLERTLHDNRLIMGMFRGYTLYEVPLEYLTWLSSHTQDKRVYAIASQVYKERVVSSDKFNKEI